MNVKRHFVFRMNNTEAFSIRMDSSEAFSLREYVSPYIGEGKISRLLFIAEKKPELSKQCWEEVESVVMEQAAKTGFSNVDLYKRCMEMLGKPVDKTWVAQVQSLSSLKLERLQNDLKAVFDSSQRNDVRTLQSEIGDMYAVQGKYGEALKCYYKCRTYNSTVEQSVETFMKIITIHCSSGTASKSQTHVSKAENSLTNSDVITHANLKVASALVSLANGNFRTAAFKFLEVPSSFTGDSFKSVMVPRDIALFGVFCALAAFSRSELKTNVLENRNFREFLELQPDLRELVKTCFLCKYSHFLLLLAKWSPRAHLEYLMSPHSMTLYEKIRSRVLVQYVTPYSALSLLTMATVFSCSVKELQKELCTLIMNGSICARIDAHNKVLHAKIVEKRNQTFQDTIQMGEKHQQQMCGFILRNNLLKWNFSVKSIESRNK